jgi:hypothetical protein
MDSGSGSGSDTEEGERRPSDSEDFRFEVDYPGQRKHMRDKINSSEEKSWAWRKGLARVGHLYCTTLLSRREAHYRFHEGGFTHLTVDLHWRGVNRLYLDLWEDNLAQRLPEAAVEKKRLHPGANQACLFWALIDFAGWHQLAKHSEVTGHAESHMGYRYKGKPREEKLAVQSKLVGYYQRLGFTTKETKWVDHYGEEIASTPFRGDLATILDSLRPVVMAQAPGPLPQWAGVIMWPAFDGDGDPIHEPTHWDEGTTRRWINPYKAHHRAHRGTVEEAFLGDAPLPTPPPTPPSARPDPPGFVPVPIRNIFEPTPAPPAAPPPNPWAQPSPFFPH